VIDLQANVAQHMKYPAGDGSPMELPPSEAAIARDAVGARRLINLQGVLQAIGLTMRFDPTPGHLVLRDESSGRQWADRSNLIASFVRSGRPKLASLVRVLQKKIEVQ
jgi:hypothetical protein